MSKIDDEILNNTGDDFDEELEREIEEILEKDLGDDYVDDSEADYDEDYEDSADEADDEYEEEVEEEYDEDSDAEDDEEYDAEAYDEEPADYDSESYEDYAEETGTPRKDPRSELDKFADEPEEYVDYYGIEQVKKRPAKKIIPKEQEKTRSLRMKRYKEQSLARYSNIYMIAGVFIGIAIFFFLVSPELKDNYDEKVRALETKYNQTLSTKNNEIDNLKQEVDGLTAKNEEYENTQAAMQTNIDNLTSEVEMLKQNIESGGLLVASSTDAFVATTTDAASLPKGIAVKNAAAERNNANVIGISRTAIEEMIKNE